MSAGMTADVLTDVLIAGAGVAGASLAFELAERGIASVVLGGAGGEPVASQLPAAVLNPHRGRSARASALDLAGAAATLALGARLAAAGHEPGVHAGGVVRVASSARQAAAWIRLSRERTDLEPFAPGELGPSLHAPFGGVRVGGGGWVEPALLLTALHRAASGLATHVAAGRLLGYRRTGDATAPLACDTSVGEVSARGLVFCLGAYDAAATRLPRLALERGGALRVRLPHPGATPAEVRAVAGPVCAIATSADEVVITGGHVAPDAEIDHGGLLAAATWYLPALANAVVEETWSALRARRRSGAPVVRRLSPSVHLFGALGGRGFLVGPLLAARLAERLAASLAARPGAS